MAGDCACRFYARDATALFRTAVIVPHSPRKEYIPMIKDLPKECPLESIHLMDFGDAEARDDSLLIQCAIQLPMFREIRSGKKDIIHGYRGTGKSSMVRFLAEGTLKFEEEQGFTSKVLVVDEELEYRTIRDYLNRQIAKGTSADLLVRLVWDILICYRAMKFIQQEISDTDSTLREKIRDIDVLFGTEKRKVGFVEVLLTHKKKIGVRLDTNMPNIVDMYAGLEPNSPAAGEEEVSVLRIADHIKYLARVGRISRRRHPPYVGPTPAAPTRPGPAVRVLRVRLRRNAGRHPADCAFG